MYLRPSRTGPERTSKHRPTLTVLTAAAVSLGLMVAVPVEAHAATRTIEHATFEWATSKVWQGAAANNSCNQFIAGVGDGTEDTYKTSDEDLHLVKRGLDGSAVTVTAENRCLEMGANDAGQRGLWINGAGTTDTATGVTTIKWKGALTVNSYGGLAPWYIEDPKLVTSGDGTGSLFATAGGYAASMANPGTKEPLPPENDVRVMDFKNVSIDGDSLSATPVYQGVNYTRLIDPKDPSKGRESSPAITDEIKAQRPDWGSWPTPFVDFQYRTGLASYWHTSGLSADPNKPPLPVKFSLDGGLPTTVPLTDPPKITTQPKETNRVAGEDAILGVTASGDNLTYQWERNTGSGFTAVAGAVRSQLALADVTDADAGYYRVLITNGQRGVYSNAVTVTVGAYEPLTQQGGTSNQALFAGNTAYVDSSFTGFPAPRYKPQISRDNGKTWNDLADYSTASYFAYVDVPASDDGAKIRFQVTNGRDTTASTPGTLTVWPKPTTPTAKLDPASPAVYDPAEVINISALAAGFPVPTPDLYNAIVPAKVWAARGASYDGTGAIGQYVKEGASNFDAGYGYVSVAGIPAKTLDPKTRYVLASYSTDPDDRSLDAAVPIVLAGQEAPVASRTTATLSRSSAVLGARVTTTVAVTRAGKPASGTVSLTTGKYRSTATLSKAGRATLALPSSLAVGAHKIAVAYAGNVTTKASAGSATLRVVKAASRAFSKLGKRPTSTRTGRVTVWAKGVAGVAAPAGKVRVTLVRGDTTRTVTVTVRGGKHKAAKLPALHKGRWRAYVRFLGSSQYRASVTKRIGTVRVTR